MCEFWETALFQHWTLFPGTDGIALYAELMLADTGGPTGFAFHARALASRETLWTSTNTTGPPFIQDGVVYHGGLDGTLHGLSLQTGEEVQSLALMAIGTNMMNFEVADIKATMAGLKERGLKPRPAGPKNSGIDLIDPDGNVIYIMPIQP